MAAFNKTSTANLMPLLAAPQSPAIGDDGTDRDGQKAGHTWPIGAAS